MAVLGHIVSSNGIRVDTQKIEEVQNWSRSTSLIDIRSFLGLASYYMRDDHLPLVEFAYNNSYHSGIHMAPYEALYGRRCRSPIGWFDVGEAGLIGPKLVIQAMELRTKEVASVKVLWKNQFIEEATWEAEEYMKERYHISLSPEKFQIKKRVQEEKRGERKEDSRCSSSFHVIRGLFRQGFDPKK
ncbi:hypothetical protein MTR67_018148, partial [Solanum verrucosum]